MAHALLARVATLYTWDWLEAQRESDVALTLRSQDPFALYAAGDLASILGNFERSEQLFRASLVSDPLNPETHFMLAVVLYAVGRLDEAESEVRRCLAISPSFAFAHGLLGNILMVQGREGSVAECQREGPVGTQMTCLTKAYYMLGRTKEADAALKGAIKAHGRDHAFYIAGVFARLRQEDQAFEWLDRAYRQNDPDIEYIKSMADFDYLRGDSRYKAFLEKLHLPE
jgi:tetratricopeptide (TPR) repeat protein